MKKGSLYPTIIIQNENDMAELTVYEWLPDLLIDK